MALLNVLTGCATPAQHFDETAEHYGFTGTVLTTALFKHKIYSADRNNVSLTPKSLHVYLDGDGTPWEHEQWLAEDPTARDPLILRLMQADHAPAILLGRPCYYGLNASVNCHAKYWTSHRYAQAVVDSMAAALNQYLEKTPATELILIGYSGGGALAMLIAPYLPQVRAIITLAANLDTDAWSRHHGYPPLHDSLNPSNLGPFDPNIKQYHFAGENDRNVPASLIRPMAAKQKADFQVLEGISHNGCWECSWAALLDRLGF